MYFGGPGFEEGRAVATDAAGNFYVVGSSASSPGLPGQFLLKFNSAGALLYTVPISGRVYDVATGTGGSAYVVASRQIATEVYAMKVTSSGAIEYISDIPGLAINFSGFERPAIAAGITGNAVVVGRSTFGTVGVPQTNVGPLGDEDAVAVMLDPRGVLTSATFIGGSGADAAAEVAVDFSGSIYVVGRTRSADFPATPGVVRRPVPAGTCRFPSTPCDDAFLVKLGAQGALVFATYYGGIGGDRATAVGVDRGGGVYVVGNANSPDLQVVRAVQPTSPLCPSDPLFCSPSPFVVRYDRTASALTFATYLAGTVSTIANGIAVDPSGNAYVVGVNRGNDFPLLLATQPDNHGGPMVVSDDSGQTWLPSSNLRANRLQAIAWTTDAQPIVYAASDRGLFLSADHGLTWTKRTTFPTRFVSALAIDPVTSQTLYAAIANEGPFPSPDRPGDLLKSVDGGESWVSIGNGLSELARAFVGSIAVAPSQPSTLYIAAGGSRVYASDDGGSTWRGGTEEGYAVGVHPANALRVYATGRNSIKVSTDGGNTWRTTGSGAGIGYPERTGIIVVNPAQPSQVYVGLNNGLARSNDAGETWERFPLGYFDTPYHVAIDPASPGDVWVAKRHISRLDAGSSTFTVVETRFPFTELISLHNGRLLGSQTWNPTGFVTAFNQSGTMLWSTFLGGNFADSVNSVSAQAGSISVVGTTQSAIWPLAAAGPYPYGGANDLFIARYFLGM